MKRSCNGDFFQMLRMTCFVLFPLMMGLAALAEPVVRLLLTDKWIETVPLIRILCFALDLVAGLEHELAVVERKAQE